MKARIPKDYKALFTNDYLYIVYWGGRGAGKSENVAQSLILLAASQKLRILCIRENQNSISESVKATLENWIDKLELHKFFKITQSSISCINGSDFIFAGMRSANAVNIKSISNVDITWIEEGEAFSKRSWQLLVPSVTRVKNPKIIVTFNPYKDDDVIYSTFVANTPPKRSFIKKVSWRDNPFFKGTSLEALMLDDRERLPEEEYEFIWEGELIKFSEGSLFKGADFTPLNIIFRRVEYTKICIACDPATTNNNFSNEFGVVVVGKTRDGTIHVIEDLSANMSVQSFAQTINNAYLMFEADEVVVEVNNGGDFIKALLMEANANLKVVEVRAFTDKINRALPISHMYISGRVKHCRRFDGLERQMRLTTHRGFLGRRGESPDRLDACVWGIHHLADLKNKDSIYSVFKDEWFKPDTEWLTKSRENAYILYVTHHKSKLVCLAIRIRVGEKSDVKFCIDDAIICETFEQLSSLENFDIGNFGIIALEDIALNAELFKLLSLKGFAVRTFERYKGKLDECALGLLPVFKSGKVAIMQDCKIRMFEGTYANLLLTELMEYKYDSKKDFYLIDLLCSAVSAES